MEMVSEVNLKTLRSFWDHLGPFGTIWDHLGQFGIIWDHLGPFGAIFASKCKIMADQSLSQINFTTLRSFQDHLGPFWDVWGQFCHFGVLQGKIIQCPTVKCQNVLGPMHSPVSK